MDYNYWTWVHEHSHGIDTGVFKTKKDIVENESEEIAKMLDIDYEPDTDNCEFFTVESFDINNIREI